MTKLVIYNIANMHMGCNGRNNYITDPHKISCHRHGKSVVLDHTGRDEKVQIYTLDLAWNLIGMRIAKLCRIKLSSITTLLFRCAKNSCDICSPDARIILFTI